MAEKKAAAVPAEEAAPEGEAPPKKKKGKLLIIIIIVLVLAAGGGAAWWFLKGNNAKPAGKGEAATKKEEHETPPVFARLETFTVNLQKTDPEDHYLQVEVHLKIADDKVNEALKLRSPEIRNALLLLMSSKTQDDLVTVEGKQQLATQIADQINKIIHSKDAKKDGVTGVYFTSFVIQ